jgi:UDP-N-acetylmuramate--alanine ligase
MKNKTKKYFHFVGIKGVGMTPLAIIAKEAGLKVTGSDIDEEFITDLALKKANIKPFTNFSAENITNPDLVITTGAHNGYDNIEVVKAKDAGIEVISAGQAAGRFMEGSIFKRSFTGISVAGTHGKTTTSGILAAIHKQNNLDSSYIIGTGSVGYIGSPGHFGKGKFFIAEADEYASEPRYDKTPKFLYQEPKIAIITNIEYDHPDIYSSLEDIVVRFREFIDRLPANGLLICCGDDRQVRKIINQYQKPVITYGFSPDNTYVINKVNISGDHMFFRASAYGRDIGQFMMSVTGEHNALNGLAAVIASVETGLPLEKARTALKSFTGSKRRFEYIGQLFSGAKVYDDYAHHPTEIKKTLLAFRTQYPNKKIICLFQPHTYSRTKKLFDEFTKAFDQVDTVIISDIYPSLREEFDPTITSKMLAGKLKNNRENVIHLSGNSEIIDYINKNKFRSDTVLVTMGAGDIYKISSQLKFLT